MRLSLSLALIVLLLGACAIETKYTVSSYEPRVTGARAEEQLLAFNDSFRFDKQPRDRPVTLLAASMPDFPREAARDNAEGLVLVRLLVDKNGRVAQVKVLKSPHPALADAVSSAVSRWRFQPITLDGQPIEQWLGFGYHFRLEG